MEKSYLNQERLIPLKLQSCQTDIRKTLLLGCFMRRTLRDEVFRNFKKQTNRFLNVLYEFHLRGISENCVKLLLTK